jgi:hypothetical protein
MSGDREIAMMGSARYLIWGPYCFVPPGQWRVNAEIEVTENYSGNVILVDISIEKGLVIAAKGQVALPSVGFFRFSLDFETGENLSPIEFRIFMAKGGIEGKFAFRCVGLKRIVGPKKTGEVVYASAFDNQPQLVVGRPSSP